MPVFQLPELWEHLDPSAEDPPPGVPSEHL